MSELWERRPPFFCRRCDIETDMSHWYQERTGAYRCKVARAEQRKQRWPNGRPAPTEEQNERRRQRDNARHAADPRKSRWAAYRQQDRIHQRGETLDRAIAIEMMAEPCHYCGVDWSGGLDRMDSSLGHIEGNVVPCCRKCNAILTDLPYEAKSLLASGLKEMRRRGLLDGWEVPQARHLEPVSARALGKTQRREPMVAADRANEEASRCRGS